MTQQFIDAYNTDAIVTAQKTSTTAGINGETTYSYISRESIIPQSLRLDVLRMHHDDPLAGHFGIARTLELLSRNYWFPSMSVLRREVRVNMRYLFSRKTFSTFQTRGTNASSCTPGSMERNHLRLCH